MAGRMLLLDKDVSQAVSKLTKKHSWLSEGTDDNLAVAQRFLAGSMAAGAAGASSWAGPSF